MLNNITYVNIVNQIEIVNQKLSNFNCNVLFNITYV